MMGSDRHFEYQNSLPSLLAAERAKVADLERHAQEQQALWLDVMERKTGMSRADLVAALREAESSADAEREDDAEYHPAIARGDE